MAQDWFNQAQSEWKPQSPSSPTMGQHSVSAQKPDWMARSGMGAPGMTGQFDSQLPAGAQSLTGGVSTGPVGSTMPTASTPMQQFPPQQAPVSMRRPPVGFEPEGHVPGTPYGEEMGSEEDDLMTMLQRLFGGQGMGNPGGQRPDQGIPRQPRNTRARGQGQGNSRQSQLMGALQQLMRQGQRQGQRPRVGQGRPNNLRSTGRPASWARQAQR